MKTPDIVLKGRDNGEGMVIHYQTHKGTNIFGLAIPNLHMEVDWDLGPTWCYIIQGLKTTLIDTGRFGNYEIFKTLLKVTGQELGDIDRIIITHSHEDHDGNLFEVLSSTEAELWAHSIYHQMIYYHRQVKRGTRHPELPGSCRMCPMPENVYRHCLPYLEKRSTLSVNYDINDDQTAIVDGSLRFIFTPGHTPDSICIILDNELIFTGDTVLPDITPHPSLEDDFKANRQILPEKYRRENTVYGLMNYIKSLDKVITLPNQPLSATFPAHRLFYNGQFNIIASSSQRAKGIIQFHIDRCQDILEIIGNKQIGIEDIALEYFPPGLLKGTGILLAISEIQAHLETLIKCGDLLWVDGRTKLVQHTGSKNFLTVLGAYLH